MEWSSYLVVQVAVVVMVQPLERVLETSRVQVLPASSTSFTRGNGRVKWTIGVSNTSLGKVTGGGVLLPSVAYRATATAVPNARSDLPVTH